MIIIKCFLLVNRYVSSWGKYYPASSPRSPPYHGWRLLNIMVRKFSLFLSSFIGCFDLLKLSCMFSFIVWLLLSHNQSSCIMCVLTVMYLLQLLLSFFVELWLVQQKFVVLCMWYLSWILCSIFTEWFSSFVPRDAPISHVLLLRRFLETVTQKDLRYFFAHTCFEVRNKGKTMNFHW